MRGFLLPIAATAVVALASPMAAYAKNNHNDTPPVLYPELRFGVTGVVPVDCSLSRSVKNVSIEDLASDTNEATAARAKLPFNVSCNTPVTVSLKSRHGGLEFEGTPTTDEDFTSLVAYSAKVNLPGNRNALACESDDMAKGGEGCSAKVDDPLMDGEGAIAVTVRPGGGLLQKGTYSDRVTIILTPTLGSDL